MNLRKIARKEAKKLAADLGWDDNPYNPKKHLKSKKALPDIEERDYEHIEYDPSKSLEEVLRLAQRKISSSNKATKGELLEAIQRKFGNRKFTFKKCLTLLEGFNHSKKIYVLLDKLVGDGKLKKLQDGYKLLEAQLKPISTETFVEKFCEGKKLPVSQIRLEIALSHVVGETINEKNRNKAMKTLRRAIAEKTKVVAGVGMQCPRCGQSMTPVTLSANVPAWFCTNDRVSLPR